MPLRYHVIIYQLPRLSRAPALASSHQPRDLVPDLPTACGVWVVGYHVSRITYHVSRITYHVSRIPVVMESRIADRGSRSLFQRDRRPISYGSLHGHSGEPSIWSQQSSYHILIIVIPMRLNLQYDTQRSGFPRGERLTVWVGDG